MSNDDISTLQNILEAGKREFLEKGFNGASLRNIVKEAGVTTGAFYGYYGTKKDLFHALVDEPAKVFVESFQAAQNQFAALSPQEQQANMGEISGECMNTMVEYIYDHFDAFKLILCCSEGTEYENFIHDLVVVEVDATHRFMSVLRTSGHSVREIDPQLEHILVSGFFSSFFETVVHDMPKEQSLRYTRELREFYTAGWSKIMGL